jgi:oligosaccharide repeat unit polymerase
VIGEGGVVPAAPVALPVPEVPGAPAAARQIERRGRTNVVFVFATLSHILTLAVAAVTSTSFDAEVACTSIAVAAVFCAIARILVGVARYGDGEIDLCWLTFQFGQLFWFGYPGFTRALQADWFRPSEVLFVRPESFIWAWIAITVFAAAFDVTYVFVRPSPFTRMVVCTLLGARIQYDPRRLLPWMTTIALLAALLYMSLSGGINALMDVLLSMRSSTSGKSWSSEGNYSTRMSTMSSLIDAALCLAGIVLGDIFLNQRVQGRARIVSGVAWLASCGFLVLGAGGTRSVLALCVCAPLSLYVRERLRSGFGLRRIIALAVAALAVLYVSSYLRATRMKGLQEDVEEVALVYHGDVDMVGCTALAYDIFGINQEQPYYESAAWAVLVNPIPRWLWPTKPDSQIIIDFSWYDWGVDVTKVGGNSLPSMVGQSLLSWGWAGVILVALSWGFIAAQGDSAIRQTRSGWALISWALATWWMFTAFRFIGPSFFTPLYFLVIGLNLRLLFRESSKVARRLAQGPTELR